MDSPAWQYLASCVVFGVMGTVALGGLALLLLEGAYRLLGRIGELPRPWWWPGAGGGAW